MEINLSYKEITKLSSEEKKIQLQEFKIALEENILLGFRQEDSKDTSKPRKLRKSIARLLTALNQEASV